MYLNNSLKRASSLQILVLSYKHTHINTESVQRANHTKNKYSHFSTLFIELTLLLRYVNK